MKFFKGKRVMITGGDGLIGRELAELLRKEQCFIEIVDLKRGYNLKNFDACISYISEYKPDYIFHLMGIKGNPKKTKERPADFMIPMLQCDTNMIESASLCNVKRFLYTSSIAVENPESDKYPAWAKMTAETLIDAMRIQYGDRTEFCIVRPANVYGRFDNFDNPDAMVITSLIGKALKDKKLILDRKGAAQERDFINSKDVAKGMIKAMIEMPKFPVNLCSGQGVCIGNIAQYIAKELNVELEMKDLNLVLGPNKKVMKRNWDNPLTISIERGITEAIKWTPKTS